MPASRKDGSVVGGRKAKFACIGWWAVTSYLQPASILHGTDLFELFDHDSFTRKIRCNRVEPRCAYCTHMEKDCVYDRRVRRKGTDRIPGAQKTVAGKKKKCAAGRTGTPIVALQHTEARSSGDGQDHLRSSASLAEITFLSLPASSLSCLALRKEIGTEATAGEFFPAMSTASSPSVPDVYLGDGIVAVVAG